VAIAKASNELAAPGYGTTTMALLNDLMQTGAGPEAVKIRFDWSARPLFAAAALDDSCSRTCRISRSLTCFFANRPELARSISVTLDVDHQHRLLAIPNRERLVRVLH